MARKDFQEHPDVGSGRIGVAVVDVQTLHRGHLALLNEMSMTCDEAVVCIGSTKRFGVPGHPFTFEQRKAMVEALYGDLFRFVPLDDIDVSENIQDWWTYVSKKIAGLGLPEPTDYFSGSRIDARYYTHAFAEVSHPSERRVMTTVFTNPDTGRRLHIVDRDETGIPSGREVRLLIETRDPEWRKYVAERLHGFVERNYPPALRQPIDFDAAMAALPAGTATPLPWEADGDRAWGLRVAAGVSGGHVEGLMDRLGTFPVGTRISGANAEVLELKDDGKWRPLKGESEKTAWARDRKPGKAK